MRITWFALYCGLMLGLSSFSIDSLLPAFAGIGADLGVDGKRVQLLIMMYLLGLGVAHPFYGALSDRYGRKVGVYLGLMLFLVGSLVCLWAASFWILMSGRFLQGFGGAAGAVVCRAMLRDRFSGSELAQNMAVASMFFAIGPVLAPFIGYAVSEVFGWRGIFAFSAILGVALSFATLKQPETLASELRKKSSFKAVLDNFVYIYRHRQSRYFVVLGACCTCLIITFLQHAPVVYEQLGADSRRFVILFALSSIGIVVGQIVNHRLIHHYGPIGAARSATVVVSLTSLFILLFIITGTLTDVRLSFLMLAFHTSFMVIYSNIVSIALDPHRERAGAASAVFGFSGYVLGSAMAGLITFIVDEKLDRWSLCFFLVSAVIAAGAWKWRPSMQSDTAG